MTRFIILGLLSIFLGTASGAILFTEGFDDIAALGSAGWVFQNNSAPLGDTDWFQGNPGVFPSQSGAPDSYIAANFDNADPGGGNISNWLITPVFSLIDGSLFSFYTRSNGALPDRLEVRLNTSGTTDTGVTDTSVGGFTSLLLTVNPALNGSYPSDWTKFDVVISGVPTPTNTRIGFRYFVPDTNINGDYIGIDTLEVNFIPEPGAFVLVAAGLAAIAAVRRRMMLLGLIACVSVAFAGDRPTAKKPARVQKNQPRAEPGMMISRDPDTGQLQSGGLSTQSPRAAARVAPPQQVRLPNGMIMVRATEAHMSTSVVTRDTDGNLAYRCVDGKVKAQALIERLDRESKAHAAGKERAHAR